MKINAEGVDKYLNSYIVGSSVEMNNYFKGLDPFIDLIVTSPPYWNMKKYGDIDEQTGHGQTYHEYLKDLQKIFTDTYEYSKTHASMFIIIDTMKRSGEMLRLPDDLANVLEKIGWVHSDTIIWDKGKTLPWSRKGQMRNVFEYILMFTKGDSKNYKYNIDSIKTVDDLKEWWIDYPERYSPDGKVPSNIWEFAIPTQGSWGTKRDFGKGEFKHACPFPPEMMARIIKLSSDERDVIFDPFAGTGVLFATAKLLNRQFIGFDTNPEYKRVFESITIPLLEQKWDGIEGFYKEQERLKEVLRETIYKLRILKYPKALVKSMRRQLKDSDLKCDFNLIIAEEKNITDENILNKKIGKVHYTFVWNNPDTIEKAKDIILDISCKAPFTKYGLITSISVILINSLRDVCNTSTKSYFLYANGIIKDFYDENKIQYYQSLFSEDTQTELFDKEIPPILSTVKIQGKEYSELRKNT